MKNLFNRKMIIGASLALLVTSLMVLTNSGQSLKMAHASESVLGIDVSKYQGAINWSEVANAGLLFAYARATEGGDYVDPMFAANWQGMQVAGLKRGAYHFYDYGDAATLQAEAFLSQLSMQSGDLRPMLDVESASLNGASDVDPQTLQRKVLEWLESVAEKVGCDPVLYSSESFASTYFNSSAFLKYQLWVAEYGVEQPKSVNPWGNDWTIWQYSDSGSVPGISGAVDQDRFNGNAAEFNRQMVCD